MGTNTFTSITLSPNQSGANYNFGELQPASLAGFVYVDANDDGIKQSGELGIGNVAVTLTGTDDLGNSVTQVVTTLTDGSYALNNLRPGTYTITEVQPSAYAEGKDTIGTPGGNATVQDVFSNIVLDEGVNGPTTISANCQLPTWASSRPTIRRLRCQAPRSPT